MSTRCWDEVYDRLAQLILSHRTTLIFVNTRRLAERAARHLGERIGNENVTSHHGSLAREQRLAAEQRLKAGELRALVATASLELGIDIGAVDLVCQLGSTGRSQLSLQRVGRSGHSVAGFPKGRIFPLTRDELVECAALLDSVRRGELDQLSIPEKPLDILAQQIVASVAADEWTEDELFETMARAYPYRNLSRERVRLGRADAGRRLRDQARPPQRLPASRCGQPSACGGGEELVWPRSLPAAQSPTPPTTASFWNRPAPFIGTVNEDFAIESLQATSFNLAIRRGESCG